MSLAALRDVWEGLRRRPARAGLAFLAVAAATSTLAVLLAVMGGLREKSRRLAGELGADVLAVVHQASGRGEAPLDDRDARLLAANLPGWTVSTARAREASTLGSGKKVSVISTDASLLGVRQWQVSSGRFLDEADLGLRRRSAVVTEALSRQWDWKAGDLVMLDRTPFSIVGVVRTGGAAAEEYSGRPELLLGARAVFVPKTVRVFDGEAGGSARPSTRLDAIFMKPPPSEDPENGALAAQRLLAQGAPRDGLAWVTPETLTQGVRRLQRTLGLVIGAVAALCLFSAGATLSGLMVANVADRVAEIGLRRSLGATGRDIEALFVLEACALAGGAAVASVLATHAALALARGLVPVPLKLGAASALVPVLVALGVGIAFSRWPARRAAALSPAEALRNE